VSVHFDHYSWANGTHTYNYMVAYNGIFTYACCEKKCVKNKIRGLGEFGKFSTTAYS